VTITGPGVSCRSRQHCNDCYNCPVSFIKQLTISTYQAQLTGQVRAWPMSCAVHRHDAVGKAVSPMTPAPAAMPCPLICSIGQPWLSPQYVLRLRASGPHCMMQWILASLSAADVVHAGQPCCLLFGPRRLQLLRCFRNSQLQPPHTDSHCATHTQRDNSLSHRRHWRDRGASSSWRKGNPL